MKMIIAKILIIPLMVFCSCATMYQRMAADNIKDMMIAVKVVDQAYVPFYKYAAEKLMLNEVWRDSLIGKSKEEMVKDYRYQMSSYDSAIADMQECKEDLKELSRTFDTYKKLPEAQIKKEIALFERYKKVLLKMINLKIEFSDAFLSLTAQMCKKNENIANYYRVQFSGCAFIHERGN